MLNDTMVVFGTELGATAAEQGWVNDGRDHQPARLSRGGWPAGGAEGRHGVRANQTISVITSPEKKVTGPNSTPPCCTCLGLDHTKLKYPPRGAASFAD